MRFAVEISVIVDGKRHQIGSIPIQIHLRDMKARKHLSQRQQEVLDLVVAGKCNKEIASQLFITERTAKYHVSLLMRLFGVASRIELIAVNSRQIRSGG
jgi:DNA-binding NarL/FixJ family response regulator